MTPQLTAPEAAKGAKSFCAPSISTPTRLYLSTRVRSISRRRDPVDRRQQGARGLGDADARLLAAPAARVLVGVVALGGHDVGDVAALDRALGVDEDDAGLDGDRTALRVIAVDGDAGDVDGQRLRRRADDGHDVAQAVAQVGRGLGDPAAVDRADALGVIETKFRAHALERQVLGDRERVGYPGRLSPRRSRPGRWRSCRPVRPRRSRLEST